MFSRLMQWMHKPVYESRLRELVRCILPHLHPDDRVLDVGCGFGALGRAIMDHENCPAGVNVEGLESVSRDNELIEVTSYDGQRMPFDDGAFDVVIVADVLHHEPQPDRLLDEAVRVSRRLVIIKDHKIDGLLARPRISLIDWAANAPYGVPCLFEYNTLPEWRDSHKRHNLVVENEQTTMQLYPPMVNLLFGRKLQYLAVLRVPD